MLPTCIPPYLVFYTFPHCLPLSLICQNPIGKDHTMVHLISSVNIAMHCFGILRGYEDPPLLEVLHQRITFAAEMGEYEYPRLKTHHRTFEILSNSMAILDAKISLDIFANITVYLPSLQWVLK